VPAVVGSFVISGTVVDSTYGFPAGGDTVVTQGQLVTAGPDGTFRFSGVSLPYTVSVIQFPNGPKVTTFENLTNANPTLRVLHAFPEPPSVLAPETLWTATVGGNIANDAGYLVDLAISGTDIGYFTPSTVVTSGPYGVGLAWPGTDSPTEQLAVHALALTGFFADNGGVLTGFSGYGSLTFVVDAGSTVSLPDLNVAPIATGNISGSITVPDDRVLPVSVRESRA
jgi:hypothetical protein